jgi:altronate dehydratase small subunit
MPKAILVNPKDNVAVAVEPVRKGDEILVQTEPPFRLIAATDVTVYHKFALRDLSKGESIIKYGEEIGVATADISKGAHVHVHNVTSRSLLEDEMLRAPNPPRL